MIVILHAELTSDRIAADDEPNLVSWRVLEGITEPFESFKPVEIPLWKQLKDAADQKAASMSLNQALKEYGQLLKHPYIFGEMPISEKYDVFLSMAKILKSMGFHQRAELLLYEAMAYTSEPFEAHLQLGLLFIDKEDIQKAKMHLKNCLFFREGDLPVLIYLSSLLIIEGKLHEAKFFISKVLIGLENRLVKLSSLLNTKEKYDRSKISTPVDHYLLSRWLEDLMSKVFNGEISVTTSSSIDLIKMFSNLYSWLDGNEMQGRFAFDIGQALYESGRPIAGKLMMIRGYETLDAAAEGIVSTQVVNMRLSLDYPVIPSSLSEVLEAYLNMTRYLSDSSETYVEIDLENSLDIYWPLPLLAWSGLPMSPVINELLWRFKIPAEQHNEDFFWRNWLYYPDPSKVGLPIWKRILHTDNDLDEADTSDELTKSNLPLVSRDESLIIEIGILGGHMSNHAVGQMVLRHILTMLDKNARFRVKLIALPLISDISTKHIASKVKNILNLPIDTAKALKILEGLHLDIILFPDWQPFPDQQSLMLQSRRLAPVQICFFVRGSSCSTMEMDYYILPEELKDSYLAYVPAAAINTRIRIKADNKNFTRMIRQPWQEPYNEQIILTHWEILTPKIIQDVSKGIVAAENIRANNENQASTGYKGSSLPQMAELDDSIIHKRVSYLEIEGQIFFDNQPVALLPFDPTYLHPLLDDVIFKIMRSSTSLQVVLVIPETFLHHVKDHSQKMCWARKLVRRLWTRGGNLHNRIRLLPAPINDHRLLQILRQSDMVLDTFPIGAPFNVIAMALSVGTPVVTLRPGVQLHTPIKDLIELRMHLKENKLYEGNPMYRQLLYSDIKWAPSTSVVSAFYDRIGLGDQLVANNTEQYCQIAADLVTNSEKSYQVRIKILEAVDNKSTDAIENDMNDKNFPRPGSNGYPNDFSNFLYKIGLPWAAMRAESTIPNSSIIKVNKMKVKKNKRKQYEDDENNISGKIIHSE